MRKSEQLRAIRARHQALTGINKTNKSSPHSATASLPLPSFLPANASMQAKGSYLDEVEKPSCRLSRVQGVADESKVQKPEYYDTERFFTDNLDGIANSVLVDACNILVQNLFKQATRSGSSITTALANFAKSEHLREAGITSANAPAVKCPKDVRTLYKLFNLDPQYTSYVCCPLPTCCQTYALYPGQAPPLRCTASKFGKACNEALVDGFQTINGCSQPKPIKQFDYHHFNDHVGSMLSRPGIEDAIRAHQESGDLHTELRDIMLAPALRGFEDHTGRPFIDAHGGELRLVWALSADWYNPRGNKASGKSTSVGAIAMVCLSLPPHLRNLEENIYLAGVIPGPQEPAVDATNHFLVPLVNDLHASYRRGVHYSRTHLHPAGRTSRSAIVPVIADTMASKKVTGNCSHAATYFCSRCQLHRDSINNLDVSSWPRGLTRSQHEIFANAWRDAKSKSAQAAIFKEHGIRWSPLLLLPYWQPSAWTITEAVHVVLLGLIPRHCRDLLALNFKDLPSDEQEDDLPSQAEMEKARRALESGQPSKLQALSLSLLKWLCLEEGASLPPPKKGRRTKKELVFALMGCNDVATGPENARDSDDFGLDAFLQDLSLNSNPSTKPVPLPSHTPPVFNPITKEMLTKIREDINATMRPSWQAHLPSNFGCPEHGKLKADQWRTALEFDLPVSLVRIKISRRPSRSINLENDTRLHKLVDLTLDLAMAIAWGLSRRTSAHHAERYSFYMTRYLSGIKELFPEYGLKPNHHYALHIPDILLAFGPLHGTWAFSMERLIGRLQKINTNSKIGELEATAMSMFCRKSNFLRVVTNDRSPTVLKQAWRLAAKHLNFRDLDRGTHRHEFQQAPSTSTTVPCRLDRDIEDALSLLLRPSLRSCNLDTSEVFPILHLHVDGVSYCGFDQTPAHSLVYFNSKPDDPGLLQQIPAQIRLIFQHYRSEGTDLVGEVFVALHRYLPVHLDNDPFAPYPDFRAGIFEKEPDRRVSVIRSSQVLCHANQRPWDSSSVVMRAVDRNY